MNWGRALSRIGLTALLAWIVYYCFDLYWEHIRQLPWHAFAFFAVAGTLVLIGFAYLLVWIERAFKR